MLYNVVLVSAVQQTESAIRIPISYLSFLENYLEKPSVMEISFGSNMGTNVKLV